MEEKKYEHKRELVGTRTELREDENWYMQRPMTGGEAMRVCQIALYRWNHDRPNDEVLWLAMMLSCDPALTQDWAFCIEEMLDEKKKGLPLPGIPSWLENRRFEPCACCDKCRYSASALEATPDTKKEE